MLFKHLDENEGKIHRQILITKHFLHPNMVYLRKIYVLQIEIRLYSGSLYL
jgi:hypothetical protein